MYKLITDDYKTLDELLDEYERVLWFIYALRNY
jgi:hypothetical protein